MTVDEPGWYEDEQYITKFWNGKKWEILLSDSRLSFGKHEVNLDEITSVRYWGTRTVNQIGQPEERHFSVADAQGEKSMAFNDIPFGLVTFGLKKRKKAEAAAFNGLVSISEQVIEPRLREQWLQAFRNGHTLKVEKLTLSQNGLTAVPDLKFKEIQLPWSAFDHAEASSGYIKVFAQRPSKANVELVRSVPMKSWNAVLLPELMPMCKAAFG